MAKTRSKAGTSAAATSKSAPKPAAATSRYVLSEEVAKPPQLFVLPKTATSESRVVTLQNPRYSKPARYLVCPETGIYEFTKIAAPSAAPRSWLIERAREGKVVADGGENGTEKKLDEFEAHVTRDADIFVATAIDPLFLVLPALAATSSKSETPKRMFLTSEDHFDALSGSGGNHLNQILRTGTIRTLLEGRMAVICDTVEAGDETMFRLNEDKLMDEILSKSRALGEKLPKSMEERFVTKPLEAPVVMRRTQPIMPKEGGSEGGSALPTPATEKSESQTSVSSVGTSESAVSQASASTAATSVDLAGEDEQIAAAMTASNEVLDLQRLRVAFSFISSAYISPSFAATLKPRLSTHKSVTFAPLDEYLAQLAKLKAEVIATRAATENTRKRGLEEEDYERAEKKRKKEEEEKKKKAGVSRGVRDLKKVNTSGMKKMSDFFMKK